MSNLNGNVTIEAIEQQIADSKKSENGNVNKKTFDENNYLDTKLKPGETSRKIKIRILPVSVDNPRFCVEIKTHSLKVHKDIATSGFKSFICLNDKQIPNYDENIKCPICSKAFELFKASKELKEKGELAKSEPLFKKACSLMNKSTYIVRVIDRNKEEQGVKFWRFNKNSKGEGIFDKLITLYQNRRDSYRENGRGDYNIFDLNNGRDIILTVTRQFDKNGKEIAPSYQIDAEDFEKPLSQDVEQMNKWIQDTKQWYDAYTARTAEYLKIIAEDEVPVKNSEGKWVAKVQQIENANKEEEAVKEAQTILEDKTVVVNTVDPSDTGDDLPF